MRHPDLGYFDEGADLTDAAFYESANRPFGKATVLPPPAFRSKIFSELEDEKIWTRSWVALGTLQEIPNGGDLLPFTVGNHGIHVQRNKDGSLTGRFNKAQHGGCRSVPLQCQTGSKTKCSFTSCGYSRDRDVIKADELGDNTPTMHQYLGLVPERLLPVKVETWGPFIFANLDPDSRPLSDELAELPTRMAAYFDRVLFLHAKARLELPSNWKLAGRAFAGLGGSLEAADDLGEGRRSSLADRFDSHVLEMLKLDHERLDHANGSALPQIPELSPDEARRATLCWVFPNLLFAALPTHVVGIIVQPWSMVESLQHFYLFTADPADETDDKEVARLSEAWLGSLGRNAGCAEALQREASANGGEAPAWVLPAQESPACHAFQTYVIGKILAKHKTYWNSPLYGCA